MKNKSYLQNYLRIEKEVIDLSYFISYDFLNLNVHSPYICDLILRCASDIESISKDIYIDYFDNNADRSKIKFDYDCIDKMIKEWSLNYRVLFVKDKYRLDPISEFIKPFEMTTINNKSNFLWNFSYQALKHNKIGSIESFANLRYLFSALGALFLLNIYYLDYQEETHFMKLLNESVQREMNPSEFFTFPVYSNFDNRDSELSIYGLDAEKASTYIIEVDVDYLKRKEQFESLDDSIKGLTQIKQEMLNNELVARYKLFLNKKKY